MSVGEAIRQLRLDPRCEDLLRDTYLDEDVSEAAERFLASAEFKEVLEIVPVPGARVLDLGAGNGIASYALAHSGAKLVAALEPDPDQEVGVGALHRLSLSLPVAPLFALGERLPFRDATIDIVYVRQVLHHASDLRVLLHECARVLRPGGVFLACREHVVDDESQLKEFLRSHPVHQLAGGENAFPLPQYIDSITSAGLEMKRILGPWDSVINAFPTVRTSDELTQLPAIILEGRLGRVGRFLGSLPLIRQLVLRRLNRPVPGRLYTFLARKGAKTH